MGLWDDQALPRLTDRLLGVSAVHALRARACAGLEGRVVEIGFGSGLNVPHYPAAVTEVLAVEPSDAAWRLARRRVAGAAVPVRRVGLDGERLPLASGTCDTALSTFTLCTIPDLPAALAELRRVLRPGGRLLFLEHGLAPDAGVARWQRRLQPVHGRMAGGCHLTRAVPALLDAAGLEVQGMDSFYGPGPKVFTYLHLGWARPS